MPLRAMLAVVELMICIWFCRCKLAVQGMAYHKLPNLGPEVHNIVDPWRLVWLQADVLVHTEGIYAHKGPLNRRGTAGPSCEQ